MAVDADGEESQRNRKDTAKLTIGGGEATSSENVEALYASIQSWGTEEEDEISSTDWKVVDKYRDPVEPTSPLANFAAVLPETKILLN